VRDGTPTLATAEHARHVIEIIEAGYRASETGQTQMLKTSFELPVIGDSKRAVKSKAGKSLKRKL
jgi:hypothetical protein